MLAFNCNKNSVYLDYLFGLNYWNSNTLYIFVIFSLGTQLRSPVLPSLLFVILFKFNLTDQYFLQKQLVGALIVGTITIHPLLFYVSLALTLILTMRRQSAYTANIVPVTTTFLIYVLVVTLVLGGYWGFQSTVWGYFWVNDTIEWLLLLVLVYCLFKVHTPLSFFQSANNFLILVFLLNLIVIVRLNFLPTRHSFIQNTNLFFYVVLGYYSTIFACWQKPGAHPCGSNVLFRVVLALTAFSKLLLLKVFFLTSLNFLLFKSRPKFFKTGLFGHLALLVFFVIWNVYFFYFDISYGRTYTVVQGLNVFVDELCVQSRQLVSSRKWFKDLEGVRFMMQDLSARQFKISLNLTVSVVLNNAHLLYVFCVYLLL